MEARSAEGPPGAPAPRRRRSRPQRLALALGYLLFLAALSEAGAFLAFCLGSGRLASAGAIRAEIELQARASGPDAPLVGLQRGRVVHPYLGFLARSWPAEPAHTVRLEEPGLYAPASPIFAADPDRLVVAVAGGSVADLFTCQGGAEVLAERLASHPRFAGKQLEFVVLATGGWKQPQQLIALTYLLALGGRIDLFIELDGFNEVALHELENQGQGVAPIYPRSWFFMTQRRETLLGLGRMEDLARARVRLAQAALASPIARSWTYRLVWRWRDDRLARSVRAVQDELRGQLGPAAAPTPEDLVLRGPPTHARSQAERLDELVRIWVDCSIQLQRLCAANGVEYYHFLQPNQYVPGSKPLSEEELESAYDPDPEYYAPAVEAGYPRLLAAADELRGQGVRFADLSGVFAEVRETVYVDACCHVNELGNRLMAEEMASFIRATTP